MEGEEDLDEDRLVEEGDDADDEDEDIEFKHRQHHHLQQQQHLETGMDCMSEVAAAMVPRVLYEELVHSYRQQEEEMRRLQQELERTRRQLVQQAKKLKEYGSLLTEVKELRDFNRRLQDVLLMRLGSGERTGSCTVTPQLCHHFRVPYVITPNAICSKFDPSCSSKTLFMNSMQIFMWEEPLFYWLFLTLWKR